MLLKRIVLAYNDSGLRLFWCLLWIWSSQCSWLRSLSISFNTCLVFCLLLEDNHTWTLLQGSGVIHKMLRIFTPIKWGCCTRAILFPCCIALPFACMPSFSLGALFLLYLESKCSRAKVFKWVISWSFPQTLLKNRCKQVWDEFGVVDFVEWFVAYPLKLYFTVSIYYHKIITYHYLIQRKFSVARNMSYE